MRKQSGVSLVELMAVLAITGIAVGIAALYLRPMEAPLQTATANLEEAGLEGSADVGRMLTQPTPGLGGARSVCLDQ